MATAADKGAVSDEKAADTAQAYEEASGQAQPAEQTHDPVVDAINEHLATLDLPEPEEPAHINKEYEEREQVEYVDVSGDDDSEPATKPKTAAKKS